MLLSAEIRLFWFHQKPVALEAWFMEAAIHGSQASGPEERTDVYLLDEKQAELGVKTRGEQPGLEVKGLIARLGDTIGFDSYTVPMELWSKWSSETLSIDTKPGVALHKKRWMRKFDTTKAPLVETQETMPEKGCNVEWTMVAIASGETCWTLGFEAYGRLGDIEKSLRQVVLLINDRKPPHASNGKALSYPALIQQIARTRTLTGPVSGD